MQQSARKTDTRTAGLHAGRRFRDLLVGMQADGRCSRELVAWTRDAARACEKAVEASGRARGKGPSVVPPEDRG